MNAATTPKTAPVKTAEELAAEATAAAERKAAEKKAKDEKAAAKKLEKEQAVAKKKAEADEKKAAKDKEATDKKAKDDADKKAKADAVEAAKKAKEANRQPEQNGVRRPGPDGACGKAWSIFDTMSAKLKQPVPIADALVEARVQTLNEANVRCEYARWKKFYGISGRVTKPEVAPVAVPPVAAGTPVAAGETAQAAPQ